MVLYHGTNMIIEQIDLNAGNSRTDFGKGFYMGSNLGIAREWADGKAGFSGIPTVMRYTVDDTVLHDACVNPLRFNAPTIEWLDFVKENRRILPPGEASTEPRHSYGAISGPIANARANIVVSDYCNGRITAEEALVRIRTMKSVFQLSLHTQLALTYIETVEYQQRIKSNKWSLWKKLSLLKQEDYINDPCGTCSTAYWKNDAFNKPEGIRIIHKRDFMPLDTSKYTVDYYFKLLNNLEKISAPKLDDMYYFATATIPNDNELVANLINRCYDGMGISPDTIDEWTRFNVFDNDLWLFIYDKSSALPVALGIADFDKEIGEGSLEWIQVLPENRKCGLGQAIINELLQRLKSRGAKFVTVSGQVDNLSKPESVYRKCGFAGDDIWCVIRTV